MTFYYGKTKYYSSASEGIRYPAGREYLGCPKRSSWWNNQENNGSRDGGASRI